MDTGPDGAQTPKQSGRGCPIFDASIDLEHRTVIPRLVIPFGGEQVPVAGVPARPRHHIDARTPAKCLAHRHVQASATEVTNWLAEKSPITFCAQVFWPQCGIHHRGHIVIPAGFQQKNCHIGIFGEPAGNHRTGCAGAAYDEVVGIQQSRF
jgi:hypothetical protein